MKKHGVLILSVVVTMVLLFLLTTLFYYFFGVKQEYYSLSSEIFFSNTNGIIEGYKINYDDFKNEDGNFELKINVGSQELRPINYEVSVLVNYE